MKHLCQIEWVFPEKRVILQNFSSVGIGIYDPKPAFEVLPIGWCTPL